MLGNAVLGPTRVRFTSDRDARVAGAWYPYTANLAGELSSLSAAVTPLLGEITSISVHWQSYRRYPGLDSEDAPTIPPLMTISATDRDATLLVIPCRTSSSLAAMLLRLASDTELEGAHTYSLECNKGRRILSLAEQYMSELDDDAVVR